MAKRTNNDLQNFTQKTKDGATQTPLITRVNSGAPEGLFAYNFTTILIIQQSGNNAGFKVLRISILY